MTFRFALEAPELLAAIACLSGHFRFPNATFRRRVPLVYFFGELDPLSPFHGGEVELPWGKREARPSAQSSADAWVKLMELPPEPLQTTEENGVTKKMYGDAFHFYSVSDLGHVWPGGHRLLPAAIAGPESLRLIANNVIWDFFSVRPRKR